MTAAADRYRRIAAAFSERVDAVAPGDWDRPAPCEGWVARDVVGHLCEWVPSLVFDGAGVPRPDLPDVAEDPVGAWHALDAALLAALEDPAVAERELDVPMGRQSVEVTIDRFVTGDVFLHAWDLARATGLDERLDPGEVHAALVAMEPIDELLRQSGHYGPKVEVPADADEQTRLLAFIGRQP